MSKDVRQLRDEAGTASASGRHKRALECYTELEQLEPRDAQWPKRAAEAYRKLNKTRAAIDAFDRAADRFAVVLALVILAFPWMLGAFAYSFAVRA